MLIGNPIYDSIFKFLMEDLAVAKSLISNIIGEEIVEIEAKPQEKTLHLDIFMITVMRLDFKAVIRTKDGGLKKVLIELQKAKQAFDLIRFRKYLGKNYLEIDEINGEKRGLPIITIYFLGFMLTLEPAVVYVGRQYYDHISGEPILAKDAFIEQLTHDSYYIQIPRLTEKTVHKLERMLSFFDQRWVYSSATPWMLRYPEGFIGDEKDEDWYLIYKRLSQVAMNKELQEKAEIEESFEEQLEQVIREKEQALAEALRLQESERQAKEEALQLQESERQAKEEALRLQESERQAKEEALQLQESERQAKEKALRQMEVLKQELERLKKIM